MFGQLDMMAYQATQNKRVPFKLVVLGEPRVGKTLIKKVRAADVGVFTMV